MVCGLQQSGVPYPKVWLLTHLNAHNAKRAEQTEFLLTNKDYKIHENDFPSPSDKISKAMPLTWKLAEGLARGLSVDPSCEFVHVLALGSLSLNSLKTHYSSILGVFANVMINQHGASGDGESIPVWLDT